MKEIPLFKKEKKIEICFLVFKKYRIKLSMLISVCKLKVLYELKTALNDSACSVDERFSILKDRLQAIEKRNDSKPSGLSSQTIGGHHMFAKPLTPTGFDDMSMHSRPMNPLLMGSSKGDEYRRAQKLKKEHRKTRVIRIQPSDGSLLNITNRDGAAAGELSPYSQTMRELELEMTPNDDKTKDPDWANTPIGGLVAKKRSRLTISKKVKEQISVFKATLIVNPPFFV